MRVFIESRYFEWTYLGVGPVRSEEHGFGIVEIISSYSACIRGAKGLSKIDF